MSEKSFPYKSINKDRMYGVQDWREYFATFIGNGVFYNPSTNLQILAYSGMTVVLKSGKAFYNGTYYNLTEDVEITIDTAEASLNRRDDVVIQFNDTDRKAKSIYRKGTPSANPVVNNLQRDSLIYEIRVASIYVGSGITQIDQQNITDTRLDNEQCGIVHGLIDQVDTETIFNQYEDWWRTQTDTTGYLTVDGENPSLMTDDKKVLGSINEIYVNLFNLINKLTQDTGAEYVNAVPIQSGGATTVQGILEELLPKSGGTMSGDILTSNSSNLGSDSERWENGYFKELFSNIVRGTNGVLYCQGGFRPLPADTAKYSLGNPDARWVNLYLSGGVYAAGTSVMKGIRPDANNTIDLGTSSYKYRNVYTGTIATAGGGKIQNTQSGEMYIHANSEANNAVFFGVRNSVWTLCPHVSGKVALGNSNFKWGQIYSTNSTISTSDENEKNTIESLDKEKAAEFIKGVNPVSYKLNDGTSGRTHWGMISQDIEKLMNEKGMSSLDFAGFIKSPKTEQVKTGEDENGEPVYEDKAIEGEYTYGLRYEEFIAPMIATIQYQQQKIDEQSKQIEDLTRRIEMLEKF